MTAPLDLDPERALLDSCLARLRDRTGLAATATVRDVAVGEPGAWTDAVLEIEGPVGTLRFDVEVRKRARPATVRALLAEWLARKGAGPNAPLLCTDHVGRNVAALLDEAGVAFLDRSGNASVRGPGLFVHVVGEPPTRDESADRGRPKRTPLARPAGLRLVTVILRDPAIVGRDLRTISAAAGIGTATASRLVRELVDEGWIVASGRRRRATRLAELHARWVEGYLGVLRPTLRPRRMVCVGTKHPLGILSHWSEWAETRGAESAGAIGGAFTAKEAHDLDLQTDQMTLHVPKETRSALVAELGLRPAKNGFVTVLDAIGPVEGRADALDLHAELLVDVDERSAAAAAELERRILAPRWEAA